MLTLLLNELLLLQGPIIGTFGASGSVHGTNNGVADRSQVSTVVGLVSFDCSIISVTRI